MINPGQIFLASCRGTPRLIPILLAAYWRRRPMRLTAGNQRLSFKFRMNGLFAGSEEGIAVNVDNRPRPGIETEDKIGHKNIKG